LPQWLLLTLAFIAMLAAGAALGWVFLRSRFF